MLQFNKEEDKKNCLNQSDNILVLTGQVNEEVKELKKYEQVRHGEILNSGLLNRTENKNIRENRMENRNEEENTHEEEVQNLENPNEEENKSLSKDKNLTSEKGKKNKKETNVNFIVQYNRYKPTRIHVSKKNNNTPVVKKNTNQYINCNFRYYVKEKNYLMQNIDDNIKWEQIEKVDYITFDNTCLTCPICLENNIISPRITKCRHIFCFFCILKYFIDEEKKTWKKCPICFEIINENDLRVVKFHYVKNYKIKDNINMCLLYTENKKINLKSDRLYFNNTFKITNNNFVKNNKNIDYKYIVNIDNMNKNLTTYSQNHSDKILKLNLNLGIQFSKLFYIYNPLSIWLKDLTIFNFILTNKKMKFFASDENVIIKAISNIKLKISEYLNIPIDKLNPQLNIDENSFNCFYLYDNLAHDVYDSIEQIKKEMMLEVEFLKNQKELTDNRCNVEIEKNNNEKSENLKYLDQIYFYQCIDGQCIFLDPFILKLLFFECDNDMNRMPKFLCNRQITYIESFELDEKIRRRNTILSHLPLGVNVLFVSLNIDDILSKRTKTYFSKEISERKKKHLTILKKKIKEEKYFKLLADEEINRKEKRYWNLPNNTISIQNDSLSASSSSLRYSNYMEEKKYIHEELPTDAMLQYDHCIMSKGLVNMNALDEKHKSDDKVYVPNNAIKKNINNTSKKKNENKNNGKHKNIKTDFNSSEPLNVKDKNNQLPKRSFLEIAKKKCDINNIKCEIPQEKEQKLSIGSGSLSINLIDLINNKTSKKKKRK
ncbi:RING zinc finger protein [Plasmodium brasilianum]|uniref:RING zinc finger protein n=1 Tax=Plasmodium brasilianum TaxID=5824 RepID=A0ACB9YB10_PLABR|nr:RING zinc finger protein [Plasmodium brasilianum]